MKWVLPFIVALALAGCSLFHPSTSSLPPQPEAPTSGGVVKEVDDSQTTSDSKLSASIAEARLQNKNGQPAKVEAELSVASSFLPPPNANDLAEAHARAERMNPEEYQKAIAYGMALQKKIDDAWSKMEADTKEAQRISALKDQQIIELKKQMEDVKRNADRNLYTMCAVALLTLGGLAMAFSKYVAGGSLMVAGTIVGAVPYLLDSAWFVPSIGIIAFVGLFATTWHIFKQDAKKTS